MYNMPYGSVLKNGTFSRKAEKNATNSSECVIRTYSSDNIPILPSFTSVEAHNCTLSRYKKDFGNLGVPQGSGPQGPR